MCSPSGPSYLKGGCSLSGIHDLEPIRLSYLNAQVRLTLNEVDKYSPVRVVESMVPEEVKLPPIIIAVGAKRGKSIFIKPIV